MHLPVASGQAPAAPTTAAPAATIALSEVDRRALAEFEHKAALAQQLGATHVPITDGLPPATWQFVPADDPYPAWYIERPDFLKLFPPADVKPYVDTQYAGRVASILEERCRILRRLGLKAHWASNIPQVMPEAFFTAHPELRGPRVDQPNRSRTARFVMCVDRPETLRLYAAALTSLLTHCPEIESFAFLTQDSGSGFCWVPSLYPGLNGNSECRERPVSDRVASFLTTLHDAAVRAGHPVEISLNPITPRQWMVPSFAPEVLDAIVHKIPAGVAVQGREGPAGAPFVAIGGSDAYVRSAFYPVVDILVPDFRWLHGGSMSVTSRAGRRLISLRADEATMVLNARVHDALASAASGAVVDRLAALRALAAKEAGEDHADDLLRIWLLLDDANRRLDALNFGDMLQFGHVLNRWINRPFVPFPAELSPDQTQYYRRFLFQAKGAEQANDLVDIQAMRMYEGYGPRLLFQRVIELTVPDITAAMADAERIGSATQDARQRAGWELLRRRLDAVVCLLRTADHAVAYQAQLDRVRALGRQPEPNPPLGAESSWDRTDLMRIAREEIDNTAHLKRLLESSDQPILDLAPVPQEETIMRLGPALAQQLQLKIDLMNAHWGDYDRLFTKPNP